MYQNVHFANTVCSFKKNNQSVFTRTSLVLNAEPNSQAYSAVSISDIPWDQLWQIAEPILDTTLHNVEDSVKFWIENYDDSKNILELLKEISRIGAFDDLFYDKKKMWPYFVRNLDNQTFHDLVYSSSYITQPTVSDSTNKMMSKAVANSQYLHTIRVLYRTQTKQIEILRNYNSEKNNIYFIDFLEGNKQSVHQGMGSNLEFLAKKEIEKFEENAENTSITPRLYSGNPDLNYTRRLSDLLLSLSYLKELDKASFWKIPGIPSIRATLSGDEAESNFERCYFVTVNEYEPGISGKLSNKNEFNDKVFDELQNTNKPKSVKILDEIRELKQKLSEEISFCEKNNQISLPCHRSFLENISGLTASQISNFKRDELEIEAKTQFDKICNV